MTMELDDVYKLARIINENVLNGNLDKSMLKELSIGVKVTPSILYGIDKELYRMSHEDSIEGFVHTDKVIAKINSINFEFESLIKEEA